MRRAWALLISATYGGLFTLLSASSFVYIEVLGLTPAQYGLAMASGSLSYLFGTFICRRWLLRVGLIGAVRRGALFSLLGGLGMLACALLPALTTVPLVLAAQWLFAFGHGIHQPCGQTGAVGPFPQMAGLAAALAGCMLALTAFGVGLWLGWAMDGTLAPMAFGIAFWGGATAAIAWTLVQRHGVPPKVLRALHGSALQDLPPAARAPSRWPWLSACRWRSSASTRHWSTAAWTSAAPSRAPPSAPRCRTT